MLNSSIFSYRVRDCCRVEIPVDHTAQNQMPKSNYPEVDFVVTHFLMGCYNIIR